MQKDIMEREIAEIIKGFRQDSIEIEIEMNQEHVHKWISQFSPEYNSGRNFTYTERMVFPKG